MKKAKYINVKALPKAVKTGVGACMPIYPSPMKLITKDVNKILYVDDLYLMDLTLHLSIHGIKNKTKSKK